MRELGGISGQAGYAAIGVLHDDEVKFSTASGSFSGDFADAAEQSQFFEQAGSESAANVA